MFWLESYPVFAGDLQLDLLHPQLLPLGVVLGEGSPLLLHLLLPSRLTEDMIITIVWKNVYTGVGAFIKPD